MHIHTEKDREEKTKTDEERKSQQYSTPQK